MVPFCAQKRLKWGGANCYQRLSILLGSFSSTGPLQRPQIAQNGPQMEPKWIQHGTKIVPNWTQTEAKLEQVLKPNPAEMNTKSNDASIKLSTQTQPGKTIFRSISGALVAAFCAQALCPTWELALHRTPPRTLFAIIKYNSKPLHPLLEGFELSNAMACGSAARHLMGWWG